MRRQIDNDTVLGIVNVRAHRQRHGDAELGWWTNAITDATWTSGKLAK